jgi:hypothetical protein
LQGSPPRCGRPLGSRAAHRLWFEALGGRGAPKAMMGDAVSVIDQVRPTVGVVGIYSLGA